MGRLRGRGRSNRQDGADGWRAVKRDASRSQMERMLTRMNSEVVVAMVHMIHSIVDLIAEMVGAIKVEARGTAFLVIKCAKGDHRMCVKKALVSRSANPFPCQESPSWSPDVTVVGVWPHCDSPPAACYPMRPECSS